MIHKFDVPWAVFLDSDKISEEEETKNIKTVLNYKAKGIKAHTTRKREIENYLHPNLFGETVIIDDYCDMKKLAERKVLSKKWNDMNFLIKLWKLKSIFMIAVMKDMS